MPLLAGEGEQLRHIAVAEIKEDLFPHGDGFLAYSDR